MRREVQLFMGGYGVGKSTAAVSIADYIPSGFFHYLWADRPIDKLYEIYPAVENRNLLEYPVVSFQDTIAALNQINAAVPADRGRDHWIIIDTVGQIYRSVQDHYAREVYGKSLDELKLLRAEQGKGDPTFGRSLIDGFQSGEWRRIRDMFYNEFFFRVLRRMNTHLILIAHAVPQKGNFYTRPDAVVAKDRFKKLGLLPDVHHSVLGFVDTVMNFGIEEDGSFTVETIKESGKRTVLDVPTKFTNFWETYEAIALGRNGINDDNSH